MSTKELLHHAVDEMTEDQKSKAQKAYETIAKLRKPYTTITDEDEKESYHRHLEEKYENLG